METIYRGRKTHFKIYLSSHLFKNNQTYKVPDLLAPKLDLLFARNSAWTFVDVTVNVRRIQDNGWTSSFTRWWRARFGLTVCVVFEPVVRFTMLLAAVWKTNLLRQTEKMSRYLVAALIYSKMFIKFYRCIIIYLFCSKNLVPNFNKLFFSNENISAVWGFLRQVVSIDFSFLKDDLRRAKN